jgi:high affinity sulfate transporter 1
VKTTEAIERYLPGLHTLLGYKRAWLRDDLVAGLVVSAVLVPAGMGYAEAAGLPAVTGLYATIIPLLVYALFGPSRVMVLGPDSGLAALIAAAIVASAGSESPERAATLGSGLALITGVTCAVMGLSRFGFITELLSKPVRVGYTNGIALTVLITQLPKLCGFSVKASGVVEGCLGFIRGVAAGRSKPEALGLGLGSLMLILGLRRLAPKMPGVLLAVGLSTLVVTAFDWSSRLVVVGAVPRGLPLPALPAVSAEDLMQMLVAGVGIALLAFADTSVLSRTFAARNGYRVDPNRELVALGAANFAAGMFGGFPISSSSSRTPVAESAGSRTQLTGVVGALLISLLLVVAPGLIKNLPSATLGAVVIAAALRIFDGQSLLLFYRARRTDLVLALFGFSAIALVGVIPGIAATVAVSLLDFVRRAWRPHDAVLGRAQGVKGYHDRTRYPEAKEIPGLLLYRWDAPLFFANADTFRTRVLAEVDSASTNVRTVLIAAEPITDIDSTAAEMLEELLAELATRQVELTFAELKDPVKDRLLRYRLKRPTSAPTSKREPAQLELLDDSAFFPTIGVAVKAFLARNDVAWTDWEDRPLAEDRAS